ncbi:MAG TPA: ABC transporter permease [Puia sp.]|jgi:ABC-type antimicrobial peptide transport system permease subunit|nr:ABC transporter permease [Puia sp.]
MLRNHLTTTIRSWRKSPAHSILNITGLALGIACAALILLWVEDELNWDHQVPDRSRIFLARMNLNFQGTIYSAPLAPAPLGPAAEKGIPGIQHSVRYADGQRKLFTVGTKTLFEDGTFADSGYFDITKIPFIKGAPQDCLRRLHSIVITASTGKKFFGDEDPMGKTMRMDTTNYTVTGVVPDFPNNYSLGFHWLAAFDDYLDLQPGFKIWGNWGKPALTIELEPGVDPNIVANQLTAMLRPKDNGYAKVDVLLQPMKDWHLYDNYTNGKPDGGQIKFVKLFSLIASIILLIACINFMNLATARAGQRAREVGVRKTLGALRQSLISRFIAESLLLSFLSVAFAVLLVYLALPAFNNLVQKELTFNPLEPVHLAGLIGIGIVCGLLSGSYPAFYLSAFNPIAVLKGVKISPKGRAGFIRKTLVTTQFVASIILIICTVIIYQQIQHIKDRDLGFDKQNLAYVDVQGKMAGHYEAIRDHLMTTGVLEHVALSFSPPLQWWSGTNNSILRWEGDDISTKTFIVQESISPGYVATLGLKIKEGRDFYPDAGIDSLSVLINESLARFMGKAGKVGNRITFADGSTPVTIVGIVPDFVANDMYGTPGPVIFYGNPAFRMNAHSLDMRLRPGVNPKTAINKITAVIQADNPGYPVEVKFADTEFQHRFDNETRIGELAGLFAVLAIFISCLGLFGLAAYTAEQRTKELGIRKVLGASVSGLAGLLSREFLQLVGLSCLIAFPLSWWAMSNWLASYAYRTPIHWWVFAAAGLGALTIALLTVSAQALKAALANPVKTLRSE